MTDILDTLPSRVPERYGEDSIRAYVLERDSVRSLVLRTRWADVELSLDEASFLALALDQALALATNPNYVVPAGAERPPRKAAPRSSPDTSAIEF